MPWSSLIGRTFSFTPRFSEVMEARTNRYKPFQRFTEKPLKRLFKLKMTLLNHLAEARCE